MMNKLQYGRKILATKKASLIGRAVAMAPTGQFRSIDPVAYDYAKLGSKKASIVLGKKFYATLTRKTAAGGVNLKKILALLGASGLGAGTAYAGNTYEPTPKTPTEMTKEELDSYIADLKAKEDAKFEAETSAETDKIVADTYAEIEREKRDANRAAIKADLGRIKAEKDTVESESESDYDAEEAEWDRKFQAEIDAGVYDA